MDVNAIEVYCKSKRHHPFLIKKLDRAKGSPVTIFIDKMNPEDERHQRIAMMMMSIVDEDTKHDQLWRAIFNKRMNVVDFLLGECGVPHDTSTLRLHILTVHDQQYVLCIRYLAVSRRFDRQDFGVRSIPQTAFARYRRARHAACAIVILSKKHNFFHKDVARMLARKMVEPEYSTLEAWEPPMTVVQSAKRVWSTNELLRFLTGLILFLGWCILFSYAGKQQYLCFLQCDVFSHVTNAAFVVSAVFVAWVCSNL